MVPFALVHRAHAETHHWAPSSSTAVSTVSAAPASCGAGGAAATSCIAGAGAGGGVNGDAGDDAGGANRWVGAVAAGCTVPSNPFGGAAGRAPGGAGPPAPPAPSLPRWTATLSARPHQHGPR